MCTPVSDRQAGRQTLDTDALGLILYMFVRTVRRWLFVWLGRFAVEAQHP